MEYLESSLFICIMLDEGDKFRRVVFEFRIFVGLLIEIDCNAGKCRVWNGLEKSQVCIGPFKYNGGTCVLIINV